MDEIYRQAVGGLLGRQGGIMSRVLLIHPWRRGVASQTPHLGLAMLASVLRQAGHQVLVVDYLMLSQLDGFELPTIEHVVADFRPDVAGVSLYTVAMSEADHILSKLSDLGIPLMVGGPHATMNVVELQQDLRLSYVFKGEAESDIVQVVNTARIQSPAMIIDCQIPDPARLPVPDFSTFLMGEQIRTYPLLTSRGCPFSCSFCSVRLLSGRRWRSRLPEDCVKEVMLAREIHPCLQVVEIVDDCPTANLDHFKTFLRLYIERRIDLPLFIDNLRADRLDEELVDLAKQAGAPQMCIAVEHGHPEVFAAVNKQETLEDIRRAARLIHKGGLDLYLCFIIGLPGDNLQRTRDSIRLAKELRPKHIYWNMAHPFRGTDIRTWYESHGGYIYNDLGYTSYVGDGFRLDEPVVETPDFTRWERKKANFLAVVETDQYLLRFRNVSLLLRGAWEYQCIGPVLCSLGRKAMSVLIRKLSRVPGKSGQSDDHAA